VFLEGLLLKPYFFRLPLYGTPAILSARHAPLLLWYWESDEIFATAWVTVLDRLLAPWLERERRLDYAACYRLLQAAIDQQNVFFRRAKGEGALDTVIPVLMERVRRAR
jgi:hypothetical protein